ncbi:MAG: efflux RND transporter periplasmic adaptor subunit [Alphaproteobacteria bacterium]
MGRKNLVRAGLLVLALVAGGGIYYTTTQGKSVEKAGKAKGDRGSAPVRIAKVTQQTIPVRVDAIGTVQAHSVVQIRSRVDGQIMSAGFKEGQMVRKGDLLFQIDPRPFQAQLKQAEANRARDMAQLEKAKSDLERYSALSNKGYSSQQRFEEARAAVDVFSAAIRAGEQAIEIARLNLEFTTINAPVTGRPGSMLVYPGNLVEANKDPPLVTINEIRPIHVGFSVPEHNLAEIKRRMADGRLVASVTIPEDKGPPVTGEITFIDNQVDVSTGTILLKATFANADDRLTPGQFVNVTMTLSAIENALVVPTRAIQVNQSGTFVFVVKEDKTVEMRPVDVGPQADGVTVLLKGTTLGETVVTDGQLRLSPGAKVAPKGAEQADEKPAKKSGKKRSEPVS